MSRNESDKDSVDLTKGVKMQSIHWRTFCIPEFSTLPSDMDCMTETSPFTIGSHTLTICVYPGGIKQNRESKGHVGLFVNLHKFKMNVKITYELSVTINGIKKYSTKKLENIFSNTERSFGVEKVVKRSTLLNDLQENATDELVLLCEIYGLDTSESAQRLKMYSNLEKFLNYEEFSDVQIIMQGNEKFYAHKIILSNGSPVFASMFKHDKEKIIHVIKIEDFEREVVLELLRFIYTGQISNRSIKMVKKLLIAANKYNVELLKYLCEDNLCCNIIISNVTELIVFSHHYDAKVLKKNCLSFFNNHKAKIIHTSGFGETVKKMHPDLVTELFEHS